MKVVMMLAKSGGFWFHDDDALNTYAGNGFVVGAEVPPDFRPSADAWSEVAAIPVTLANSPIARSMYALFKGMAHYVFVNLMGGRRWCGIACEY